MTILCNETVKKNNKIFVDYYKEKSYNIHGYLRKIDAIFFVSCFCANAEQKEIKREFFYVIAKELCFAVICAVKQFSNPADLLYNASMLLLGL